MPHHIGLYEGEVVFDSLEIFREMLFNCNQMFSHHSCERLACARRTLGCYPIIGGQVEFIHTHISEDLFFSPRPDWIERPLANLNASAIASEYISSSDK